MGRLRADFEGDVAIVTGAASGIGAEISRALGAAGARVHGFDLRPPAERPHGTLFHQVDVKSGAQVEAAVARVLEREGRIQHCVNNAGITRDRALWKLEESDWNEVLDVNLSAAWRLLRAVAPAMRAAGFGRIVQISSINALRGKFGQSNYAASKAGLIGLTRTAARELGPRGITVNAVAPGMVESPMSAALPEEVRRKALEETALGRLGQASDIAHAVLYLLSDEARHVTGVVLPVDGGQVC